MKKPFKTVEQFLKDMKQGNVVVILTKTMKKARNLNIMVIML